MDETVAAAGGSTKQSDASASSSSSSRDPASPAAGGGTSSSTSDESSGQYTKKARKSTYAARREAADQLLEEVKALESHVEVLREREDGRVAQTLFLNAMLLDVRRDQQLSFAVAQSAVSGFMSADHANPLSTPIRLGNDWVQRHKTLVGMKEKKIRSAYDYVCARSRFLDPLQPHTSEERFVNANGDYCCAKFELIQFEGVQSVKQVYDALLYYLVNIEISVSERLGHITVREDYEKVEKSISNFRLLSTQCGVQIETNMVTFSKYYESHELSGGNPCGVIAVDCVDDDQLHPYLRTRRLRKDVATAVSLTPHMRKKRSGRGEELVVVMGIGKFHNLRHDPALEIPPHKFQELKANICWGPAMMKSVIDLLHPE